MNWKFNEHNFIYSSATIYISIISYKTSTWTIITQGKYR
jgi:hypothetical protein